MKTIVHYLSQIGLYTLSLLFPLYETKGLYTYWLSRTIRKRRNFMKRYMVILAILIALAASASAQTDFWSRVGFGVSSYPEENGNITKG